MLRKVISCSIATALLSSILVGAAPSAVASCVFDPEALTFHEMIDQGTTGNEDFPIMFLGIVASWSDVGGRPGGGEAIARFAVGEHPVGNAPLVSDVRFYRQYPGVSSSVEFEFRRDGRYAVVARRLDDGTFQFDGGCGQTRRLNRDRFRDLMQYARSH